MRRVSIIAFEDLTRKKDVFSVIKESLDEIFSTPCRFWGELKIPRESFNSKRNQYLASRLLQSVRGKSDSIGLGVTEKDIYSENLNFVFGQASPYNNSAILSLHRLNPSFYGESDKNLFFERVGKEAVHEIGHVLGLNHCSKEKCVMYFSNSILSVDNKEINLCESCRMKLANDLSF